MTLFRSISRKSLSNFKNILWRYWVKARFYRPSIFSVVVTHWWREWEALGSNPGKTSGEKILTREDFNSSFFFWTPYDPNIMFCTFIFSVYDFLFKSILTHCDVCLKRFMRELKRPNQRQGAFLGPLKCSNHLETKVKSCRSQKVGIKKWRRFFDSMQFAHAQCPLVGFICRKELLQQNGPQGQN